jgi:hypothetical protein
VPGTAQPSKKYFDTLVVDVLRRFDRARPLWLEAESKKIRQLQLADSNCRPTLGCHCVGNPTENSAACICAKRHSPIDHRAPDRWQKSKPCQAKVAHRHCGRLLNHSQRLIRYLCSHVMVTVASDVKR